MTDEMKSIEELELELPRKAGAAFAQAYRDALAAGYCVVVADTGGLYEVYPNGERRFIKTIEMSTQAIAGQPITIRWKKDRRVN